MTNAIAEQEDGMGGSGTSADMEQVDGSKRRHEWQPIETAPRDGSMVLIGSTEWRAVWAAQYDATRPPGERPDIWDGYGPRWQRIGFQDLCLEPTHWMSLPSPPLSEPNP